MPSQTEFEGLLEAMPDALVGVDKAGVIRFVNRQTESMFGYDRADLLGMPVETLVPESVRDVHVAQREGFDASHGTRPMGTDLQLSGQRRDGTEFPVDIALSPMETGDGMLVIAAVRDLTHSRRAEAERRRADMLAAIVEGSDDAILSGTLDAIITSWNPAAERMYGYSAEDIIGKPAESLTPGDSPGEIKATLAKIKAGQRVVRFESKRVRKDGTVFPVSLTVSPIHNGSGEVVGTSVIHRDMTQNWQTFEAARSMIETSLDSFVAISPEGHITDANQATVKLTGVPRDKLIGTSFSDYFTEPEKAEAIYQLVLTEGVAQDYPLTLRHRNGHEMLTEVLYNASVYRDANGKVLGVFAAARDVTEQEEALARSQSDRATLRATLDSLLDPHVVQEAVRDETGQIVDFVYVDANSAACAYNGLDYQDLVGARLLDLLPGHAGAGLLDQYAQVVETGEPLVQDDIVYAQELLGGQERHYDARAARVGDGLSYTWRDVTDRHTAAQKLAESEDQYRLLAENASDVVMRLSPDRRYEWVSVSVANVLGWQSPDLVGHLIEEFIHHDDLTRFRQVIADASPGSMASVECRFRCSDGTYRWVACRTRVKVDEHGTPVAVVGGLVDVADRKEAEAKELQRLEELERFQRLTIGRELKMIELKKEIEYLRKIGTAGQVEPDHEL